MRTTGSKGLEPAGPRVRDADWNRRCCSWFERDAGASSLAAALWTRGVPRAVCAVSGGRGKRPPLGRRDRKKAAGCADPARIEVARLPQLEDLRHDCAAARPRSARPQRTCVGAGPRATTRVPSTAEVGRPALFPVGCCQLMKLGRRARNARVRRPKTAACGKRRGSLACAVKRSIPGKKTQATRER